MTQAQLTASKFTWETTDGITYGYITVDDRDYDITITERVRHTMWTRESNVRTWTVTAALDNTLIACETADGLRNAKRAAITALDTHLHSKAATA